MFCVPGEPSFALAEEGDDGPTAVCVVDGWLVLGVYAAETLVLVVMVMRGWLPRPFSVSDDESPSTSESPCRNVALSQCRLVAQCLVSLHPNAYLARLYA